MRVLITGAAGQLGTDLRRLFPQAVALDHASLSISDARGVRAAIRAAQPEVVINCAAYNAVDRAEADADAARAANSVGPAVLAEACVEFGARMVHFSTNFVFDGTAPRPYKESDSPRPASVYAATKLAGEVAVLERLPDALVIRSAGLFGTTGSAIKGGSFPERILKRARDGAVLRVVSDQFLNPTSTADLATATRQLMDAGTCGLVHLVAAGCCSFLDLAQATLDLAGVNRTVDPIETIELDAAAARPLNGCLESDRVPPLRHWHEGLADHVAALEAVRTS